MKFKILKKQSKNNKYNLENNAKWLKKDLKWFGHKLMNNQKITYNCYLME